jgi:hypothetical protein
MGRILPLQAAKGARENRLNPDRAKLPEERKTAVWFAARCGFFA